MSTFFRVTTYGESRCKSFGCIIDGAPGVVPVTVVLQQCSSLFLIILLTSFTLGADLVQIQSGVEHGVTLGTPIGLVVQNKDQRPHDYSETDLYPLPSHPD